MNFPWFLLGSEVSKLMEFVTETSLKALSKIK